MSEIWLAHPDWGGGEPIEGRARWGEGPQEVDWPALPPMEVGGYRDGGPIVGEASQGEELHKVGQPQPQSNFQLRGQFAY